jgi:CubicO group peptidase (beta-lactamase class C family)
MDGFAPKINPLVDVLSCRKVLPLRQEVIMNNIFFRVLLASITLGLIMGCASLGGGQRVADPAGRFSFSVSPELTLQEQRDGFYHYRLEARGIDVYVAAVPAGTEEEGVEEALRSTGADPASLVLDGSTAFGDWQAKRLADRGRARIVAIAYQLRGGTLYSLVAAAGASAMPGDPPGSVMAILGTFRFSDAVAAAAAPATRGELEAFVRDEAEKGGGSISVAAVRDGKIMYRYSAGMSRRGEPASPGTAYHWGSMTKVVTAVAVMQLVEQGLVGLDSPIVRYLPEFPERFGITVRNLLNHTSGLPERENTHLVSYRGQALPSLVAVLSDYLAHVDRLDFTPGTESQYCNWNYLALGVLIERVTGRPYEASVAETVLRPAGMEHTSFRHDELPMGTPLASPVISSQVEPALLAVLNQNRPARDGEDVIDGRSGGRTYLTDYDILAPWGGLVGPVEDVAQFLWTNMDAGTARARWGLSPSTLQVMRQMQRAPDGRPFDRGLGWVLRQEKGEETLEHGGGGPGINTLMRVYPKRRLGIVVMGNMNDYEMARILSAAAGIL